MATSFPLREHFLGNGLRLVVSPDHLAPLAAVNLWYNVGSRHERPTRTGLAHLFEHLMFEGSRQVEPGEHFRLLGAAGGSANATTSTERTNYFETVPAQQLDLALWLEADRMGSLLDGLTQESLDKQRDIVRNERRQRYDNVPYGTAFERLCDLLFPEGHPYHHQPIGSMEDLAAASLDDVRGFFRAYYAPNNAVLTVVGDVEPDAVVERVEHYFGGVPSFDSIPPPLDAQLAPLQDEVRIAIQDKVPDSGVWLGYRVPPEGDPELDAVDLALTLLASGRSSPFARHIVRGELAKLAGGLVDRRVAGASLVVLSAVGRPDVPIEKAEAAVRAELTRLGTDGPGEAELRRAKAMLERGWLDRLDTLDGRADEISRCATLFGDPGRVNTWIDPRLRLDAADVRDAVAKHLLSAPPVVLVYEPAPTMRSAA